MDLPSLDQDGYHMINREGLKYDILKRPRLEVENYAIETIRLQDMEQIRQWRNAQIDALRQGAKLTVEDQNRYWATQILPSFQQQTPDQVLVSYLYGAACIGYGGLVHINWPAQRAEVSFLLRPDRVADDSRYRREFGIFLVLLKELAFTDLKLQRLWTETYDVRPMHVSVLEAHGFALEGRLRRHARVQSRLVDSLIHGCLDDDEQHILSK